MKLKFKLSILVILIMIIVVAGIAFLLLREASGISLDLNLRSSKYLAAQQAEFWKGRQNVRLQVLRSLANIMADYEEIDADLRRNRFDSMLHGTLVAESDLVNIYTVWKPNAVDGMDDRYIGRVGSTPSGQYAMAYSRETGRIVARATIDIDGAMAYFTGSRSRLDRVEDPFYRQLEKTDMHLLRLMVPIVNPRTDEIVGGVGCLLNIAPIQSAVEQCLKNNAQLALMAIYSGNGYVMGSLVPERVGKMLTEVETIYGENMRAVSGAVSGGREFQCEAYSPVLDSNVRMILYPFEIGNSGVYWSVMMGETEARVLAEVRSLRVFTIILALSSILATAAIVFLSLSYSIKPLTKVTGILKDISEGEGDLTRSIAVHSKDEIGDLAYYFNSTLEKIRNLVLTIKNEAAKLFNIGAELSANMTETAAAANEITANIQSIKGQVINQSASVSETNATMEQITVNIGKLNGQVENQASSVTRSSAAIEEMLANIASVAGTLVKNADNVRELMKASDAGRSDLQSTAADIQEIARESEGLMAINAVMKGIASQTNLLSMNAAIEAAHAGEAGKGFAVVADEIRKLAENSGEQSKTIGTVLKKIKTSIDKIAESAGSVLGKFEAIDSAVKTVAEQEENIRNAMEEQGVGSKQILEAIGQVNETTGQVKSGSTEMLEGSREVIHESRNLEKVTQEITGGMNEMAAGAEQINTAINHVNELSAKNREHLDLLAREVSRFKVEG